MEIFIWFIRKIIIKQRKRFINVYRLNYRLTALCLIRQFTSTSEGDFNHPTLGHKTEFQLGGSGVLVTRTCPPPTNTTLTTGDRPDD